MSNRMMTMSALKRTAKSLRKQLAKEERKAKMIDKINSLRNTLNGARNLNHQYVIENAPDDIHLQLRAPMSTPASN